MSSKSSGPPPLNRKQKYVAKTTQTGLKTNYNFKLFLHIILSRLRAVVIFFHSGGKRAICDCESTSSEAASREKNDDCSQSKFCRNIVYVSSIVRDFPFNFLHVLPNLVASRVKRGGGGGDKAAALSRTCVSQFRPYDYKQALLCDSRKTLDNNDLNQVE